MKSKMTEQEQKTLTFLVVDDEPDVVEVIQEALKSQYPLAKVFSAKDGQEANLKFKNAPPKVLITDISMPKVSGNELLQTIIAHTKAEELPYIIIISGLDREERYINEVLNGLFRFLPKPFKASELLNIVDSCISGPKMDGTFKLNADFINAFISALAGNFQNQYDIDLEKKAPFVRPQSDVSGDVSYTAEFESKNFHGSISVCFAAENLANLVEKLFSKTINPLLEADIEIFQPVFESYIASVEENLLKMGLSSQFNGYKNLVLEKHTIRISPNANAIVVPMACGDIDIRLEIAIRF